MTATLTYAGFWRRFWAYSLDTFILTLLWVGPFISITNRGQWYAWGLAAVLPRPFGFVIHLVASCLYFAFQESSMEQATLGKSALGIRVFRVSGGRISFMRATARFFIKYVPLLLLIALMLAGRHFGHLNDPYTLLIAFGLPGVILGLPIAFSPFSRGLHDVLAGTIVVHQAADTAEMPSSRQPPAAETTSPKARPQFDSVAHFVTFWAALLFVLSLPFFLTNDPQGHPISVWQALMIWPRVSAMGTLLAVGYLCAPWALMGRRVTCVGAALLAWISFLVQVPLVAQQGFSIHAQGLAPSAAPLGRVMWMFATIALAALWTWRAIHAARVPRALNRSSSVDAQLSRRVYLSLGSNLGDRAAHLACARTGLEGAGIPIIQASSVHETEPWGVAGQPKYLNQCLVCESDLAPLDLLRTVKAIERKCGREPGTRWGPRVIDIDLLLIEGVTVDDETLHLPHRHLTDREFVLAPLAEIAPDLPLPTGRTAREQLQALRIEGPHDG